MKKFVFAALSCASTLAYGYYGEEVWCYDETISLRADYGYFRRQEVRDLRLVEDTSQTKNGKPKKRLDTDDLVDRFHWNNAIRGLLTYHSDECASLEALYLYFFPWRGREEKTAKGTLQFPFKFPIGFDFQDADKADVKYKSWLQNGELNYWGHLTPQKVNYFSVSWNFGLRAIFLKEILDMSFERGDSTSPYDIETRNTLFGPQLGAMLEINPTCRWTWTFLIKGAGFLNNAKNELYIGDYDNTITLRDYSKKRWADSWLLEGYGQLAYHYLSWLSLYFAYEGFILTGVATAPAQRDVHTYSKRRINTKNQIVIDGLLSGLSISF